MNLPTARGGVGGLDSSPRLRSSRSSHYRTTVIGPSPATRWTCNVSTNKPLHPLCSERRGGSVEWIQTVSAI